MALKKSLDEIPDDAAEKIVTLKDAVSYLTDNSN